MLYSADSRPEGAVAVKQSLSLSLSGGRQQHRPGPAVGLRMTELSFLTSLVSGGLAGTAVDVSLFPLDTIKTRLQSKQGFLAAGGFRNIYSGERREVDPL